MTISLDDHRPHVSLKTDDGNAHVLPVSLLKDWATGKQTPSDHDAPVIRRIVEEWLHSLQATNGN